jgi:hypothetical protein
MYKQRPAYPALIVSIVVLVLGLAATIQLRSMAAAGEIDYGNVVMSGAGFLPCRGLCSFRHLRGISSRIYGRNLHTGARGRIIAGRSGMHGMPTAKKCF